VIRDINNCISPRGNKPEPDSIILVLHEIYGVNKHILTTAEKLRQMGFAVECPDFTGLAKPFTYDCSQAAYQHFIRDVGFAEGARRVLSHIEQVKNSGYRRVILYGFSIGATVAWLLSENKSVDGIIGFYGSRIRDYPDINPQCPTLLFFPTYEESFDVISFASSIKKEQVLVKVLEGNHGFADSFSSSYNKDSSLKADVLVSTFLSNL